MLSPNIFPLLLLADVSATPKVAQIIEGFLQLNSEVVLSYLKISNAAINKVCKSMFSIKKSGFGLVFLHCYPLISLLTVFILCHQRLYFRGRNSSQFFLGIWWLCGYTQQKYSISLSKSNTDLDSAKAFDQSWFGGEGVRMCLFKKDFKLRWSWNSDFPSWCNSCASPFLT